jgi:hypothetical protein
VREAVEVLEAPLADEGGEIAEERLDVDAPPRALERDDGLAGSHIGSPFRRRR